MTHFLHKAPDFIFSTLQNSQFRLTLLVSHIAVQSEMKIENRHPIYGDFEILEVFDSKKSAAGKILSVFWRREA